MILTLSIPMRDGVRLFTAVHLPDDTPGPFPVVLFRTLYNQADRIEAAPGWGKEGFAYVNQDVRCSCRSEGVGWDPWLQEEADGADTLAWIRAQPWCNGQICMVGGSYCGEAQLLAAASGDPALVGCVPQVMPGHFHDSTMYTGGAFLLALNAGWALGSLHRHCGIPCRPELPPLEEMLPTLPIRNLDQVYGFDAPVPWWHAWLDHPDDGPFWARYRLSSRVQAYRCPMLFIGGWFDIYTQDLIDATLAVRTHGATPLTRAATRCIIGPWIHSFQLCGYPIPEEVADRETHADKPERAFVRNILRAPDVDPLPDAPVFTVFVLGANEWRTSDTWPPPGTREQRFYLSAPDGAANTAAGAGRLIETPPAGTEAPDVFLYDPRNPVPTHGGHGICCPAGSLEQSDRELRPDVLVYRSEPLTEALTLLGRVTVELFAASSAADTDFTAVLTDIFPDGRVYNLCNGILRARYREGLDHQVPLPRNTPVRLCIDLWSIAAQIRPGHRIGLQISSSDFPQFARNLNGGGNPADESRPIPARQTVWHDAAHPSALILPVAP